MRKGWPMAAGVILFVGGCIQNQPRIDSSLSEVPAPSRSTIATVLERLMSTPVIADANTQTPDLPGFRSFTLPIAESLAADGCRYELLIVSSDGTAWIRTSGGIGDHLHSLHGPWSIDNPDVQDLLQSVGPGQAASPYPGKR